MESIDHYTKPYGPLEGGGDGKYLLWYSYLMKDEDSRKIYSFPKGLTEGTIEIPTMIINGRRYDSQKLRFKRESFIALAAVNC